MPVGGPHRGGWGGVGRSARAVSGAPRTKPVPRASFCHWLAGSLDAPTQQACQKPASLTAARPDLGRRRGAGKALTTAQRSGAPWPMNPRVPRAPKPEPKEAKRRPHQRDDLVRVRALPPEHRHARAARQGPEPHALVLAGGEHELGPGGGRRDVVDVAAVALEGLAIGVWLVFGWGIDWGLGWVLVGCWLGVGWGVGWGVVGVWRAGCGPAGKRDTSPKLAHPNLPKAHPASSP
jgi:hypothetical protein